MASKVINFGLPHYTRLPAGHSGAAEDVIVGFGDVHYTLDMTNQCGQEKNISSGYIYLYT